MSHPPLTMVGPKKIGTGKAMGPYSADEIKAWILGKLSLTRSEEIVRGSNVSMVVADFMSGRGKATSGPDTSGRKDAPKSHTSKYRGNDVYHTSAGKAATNNGVTIFYVNAQGNDGKIIGIGHHLGSTSYEVEWHVPDWHVGRRVELA